MQMLKVPLSFCVAALLGASIVHAQTSSDSDAQAKAREALRQKTEANTQSPVMPSSNIKVQNTSGVTLSMTPESNTAQEDKVRSELRRKIDELNGSSNSTATSTAQSVGSDDHDKLVEALRRKKADLDAKDQSLQDAEMARRKANEDLMAKQKASSAPTDMNAKQMSASAPGEAIAPMVPGSKEQRLNDLLQQYRADKITPTEYHQQRAKIIAEP